MSAEEYRRALDFARLYEELEELRSWRRTIQEVGGCRCDPVGSGEEWCVGACYLREALRLIVVYARSEPIVRNIAMEALTRDELVRELSTPEAMERVWAKVTKRIDEEQE